jgi:two-component system response regulator RegX3
MLRNQLLLAAFAALLMIPGVVRAQALDDAGVAAAVDHVEGGDGHGLDLSPRDIVVKRAVLRRGTDSDEGGAGDGVLEAGPVRMDVERHVVSVNGTPITLPLKEFDLLEYLMRNSGRVLTRGQLIDRVWGADYVGDTKTLDVHVKRLRSKIEQDPANPAHLVTVRGLGYKLEG